MAARSACAFEALDEDSASGRWRSRPRSVQTCAMRPENGQNRKNAEPSKRRTRPVFSTIWCCSSCHALTSGRSLYHASTVCPASSRLTPQSRLSPCFVLPYAMEKLRICKTRAQSRRQCSNKRYSCVTRTLALRRSTANMSLSSGAVGVEPSGPSHSSKQRPASTAWGHVTCVNSLLIKHSMRTASAPRECARTSPAQCESGSRRRGGRPQACFCSWPCEPAKRTSYVSGLRKMHTFAPPHAPGGAAQAGRNQRRSRSGRARK